MSKAFTLNCIKKMYKQNIAHNSKFGNGWRVMIHTYINIIQFNEWILWMTQLTVFTVDALIWKKHHLFFVFGFHKCCSYLSNLWTWLTFLLSSFLTPGFMRSDYAPSVDVSSYSFPCWLTLSLSLSKGVEFW